MPGTGMKENNGEKNVLSISLLRLIILHTRVTPLS